jgi:hypothetical protein
MRSVGPHKRNQENVVDDTLTHRMLFNKFELSQDAFQFNGNAYPLSSITHIDRFRRRTSVNFIPIGDVLRLRIHVLGLEQPITVRNGGLAFTTGNLNRIYERLAERTYESRASGYLQQIKSKGSFEYAGATFFSNGELAIKGRRIQLRAEQISLAELSVIVKEKSGWFGRKHRISVERDTDVFFALFKQLYGLSFS